MSEMVWFQKKRIFLDYASATPLLPEAKKEMEKFWSLDFYNPSAIYKESVSIKEEIENCRVKVARLTGVSKKGIIFTSGGTESNNLAILGAFEGGLTSLRKPHLIISAIEHPSIIAAADEVVRRGGEVSVLRVDQNGVISLDHLKSLLKENTFLVSIELANNEIGTIQPVGKAARIINEFRKNHDTSYPYFHTDASQAPNYLNTNVESFAVDLMTIDGSKIYGPKGIGILAVRTGTELAPILFGGSQENFMRPGTLNPALVASFTKAFEIIDKDREKEFSRLEVLRKYFIEQITKLIPKAVINGSPENHLPNIISISLPDTLSEFVVLKLDARGIMASVGSACSYDSRESGSPVIDAIGKPEFKESTIRFSMGRGTSKSDVKEALNIFCRVAKSVIK